MAEQHLFFKSSGIFRSTDPWVQYNNNSIIIYQTFWFIVLWILNSTKLVSGNLLFYILYTQCLLLPRTKIYSKTTGQGTSLGLFNKVTKNFAATRVLHTIVAAC